MKMSGRRLEVAVIGDLFMKPAAFVETLAAIGDRISLETRTLELDWPDEPMEHGYAGEASTASRNIMGGPKRSSASSAGRDPGQSSCAGHRPRCSIDCPVSS